MFFFYQSGKHLSFYYYYYKKKNYIFIIKNIHFIKGNRMENEVLLKDAYVITFNILILFYIFIVYF